MFYKKNSKDTFRLLRSSYNDSPYFKSASFSKIGIARVIIIWCIALLLMDFILFFFGMFSHTSGLLYTPVYGIIYNTLLIISNLLVFFAYVVALKLQNLSYQDTKFLLPWSMIPAAVMIIDLLPAIYQATNWIWIDYLDLLPCNLFLMLISLNFLAQNFQRKSSRMILYISITLVIIICFIEMLQISLSSMNHVIYTFFLAAEFLKNNHLLFFISHFICAYLYIKKERAVTTN